MMINFSKILRFYIFLSAITFAAVSAASTEVSDENVPQDIVTEETNLTDREAAINVKIDRRFNEIRSEVLDDKASIVSWWLFVIAIVLTFFAIVIPIASYFGYKKFEDIKEKAEENLDQIRKIKKDVVVLRETAKDHLAGMQGMGNESTVKVDTSEKTIGAIARTKNDPDASVLNNKIANALLLQRKAKNKDAIEEWRNIVRLTEDNNSDIAVNAWFSIGYLFQLENITGKNQSNNENALDAYTKAIRLNRSHVESYYNRGNLHTENKRYEDAIRDYTFAITHTAVSTAIDLGVIYFNRGNANFFIENYFDAIEDYRYAISCIDGINLRNSWYNLGNAEIKLGSYEKALESYDESIKVDVNYKNAHSNRIVAKAELGYVDEALSGIEQLTQSQSSRTEDDVLSTLIINGQIIRGNLVRKKLDGGAPYIELAVVGNVGNIGMFGGVRPPGNVRYLPGGKGFPGSPGFSLRIAI